jgi:hypothetical protein
MAKSGEAASGMSSSLPRAGDGFLDDFRLSFLPPEAMMKLSHVAP